LPHVKKEILKVYNINPVLGPVSGGSLLQVNGQGFQFLSPQNSFCLFGLSASSPLKVVSPFEAQCIVPSTTLLGPLSFGVLFENESIQTNLKYTFVNRPAIYALAPRSGPVAGGTIVNIIGQNFIDSNLLECYFGDIIVPSFWVTPSELQCVSPEHPTGEVLVGLMMSNVTVASFWTTFLFYQPPILYNIFPSAGLFKGTNRVTFSGSGFIFTDEIRCRFGWQLVEAVYVSSDTVRCSSPPAKPGIVLVTFTNNQVDFSDSNVTFEYLDIPTVYKLSPDSGATTGGTNVSLTGAGFSPGDVWCSFDSAMVSAVYISPSLLWCTAPPHTTQYISPY